MASTPLQGRYASVYLGDKSTGKLVESLGTWTIEFSLDEIDVSVFGSVWKKNITGMQGWRGTLAGIYDVADTTGQTVLREASLAATKVTNIRFYVNSTSYWSPNITGDSDSDAAAGCYIGTVSVTHDKAGVAQITMNVLGFGPLKYY